MTKTPPTKTGSDAGEQPKLTLPEQIDQLLMEIETQEPGTVSRKHLPKSFQQDRPKEKSPAPSKPAQFSPAPPVTEEVAEQMQSFADAVEQDVAAEDSVLSKPEPAKDPAEEQEPPAAQPQDAQSQMLAALNAALHGDAPEAEADDQADPADAQAQPDLPADTAAQSDAPEQDAEAKLQAEIAALLNSEPQVQQETKPEEPAPPAEDPEDLSTQDQIAQEIEGLLNQDAEQEPDQQTTIDDLDQMLANEIDEDELAGEFHSVDDVTNGIQTDETDDTPAPDEHAATARDVAAELDSQPEDRPKESFADEDPLAAIAAIADTAEKNEAVHQQQVRAQRDKHRLMQMSTWAVWLERAKERLLQACYAINWPARKFLSTENRANLGYIALLNLFAAAAVWIYLIAF